MAVHRKTRQRRRAFVIVKNEALGKVSRHIPTMLNYQTHVDKGSVFVTSCSSHLCGFADIALDKGSGLSRRNATPC